MEIRSAVLEILEEGRRTGRNVEHKTLIFVNFDYESSENGDKRCVLLLLSAGQQKYCPQGAASDAHRLNAQHVNYVYTNCFCNLMIIYHIIYFHSVDPYRITKSIWIWKQSKLLKKSRSEVNIKCTIILVTGSRTIFEVLT